MLCCALSTCAHEPIPPTPVTTTARPASSAQLEHATLAATDVGFCLITSSGTLRCRTTDRFSSQLGPQSELPQGRFVSIASVRSTFCALRDDGSVACWNANPQAPTPALFPGRYRAIRGGQWRLCGLTTDGALECHVGGRTDETFQPAMAVNGGPFEWLSTTGHACVLSRTEAVCVVPNCQTNDPATCHDEHFRIPGAFRALASADTVRCALSVDDQLNCFGNSGEALEVPPSWTGPWARLFASSKAVCAQTTAGELRCTSKQKGAELRYRTALFVTKVLTPVIEGLSPTGELAGPVTAPGTRFDALATGDGTVCGRTGDLVVCAGTFVIDEPALTDIERTGVTRLWEGEDRRICAASSARQTCFGTLRTANTMETALADPPPVASVFGRRNTACRIESGRVRCEDKGRFGKPIRPPDGVFTEVQGGNDFWCAQRADGRLQCWGEVQGRPVSTPPGEFGAYALGGLHACALTREGAIKCWGNDYFGQVSQAPPGKFTSLLTNYLHTCATRDDGAVLCWGSAHGALFSMPLARPRLPVTFDSGACAVSEDGRIGCWGKTRW